MERFAGYRLFWENLMNLVKLLQNVKKDGNLLNLYEDMFNN